ncbi:hypothetical protein [Piscinibacter defluvii]|uniref:hypothetical protein n=1 Tax=Piscinibacter defluvii TaxID=1796922 RepID=UPI00197C1688|nr:hypothetical protein [Piscinibacter defluvii]
MTSEDIKHQLLANAKEIARLNERIHETVRNRGRSAKALEEWKDACAEFHRRYDELAFPGGYDSAPERILAGEPNAIESALCFLECRPYFFRSGYMHKVLLRKVKQAPLSEAQQSRLRVVLERAAQWQAVRRSKSAA